MLNRFERLSVIGVVVALAGASAVAVAAATTEADAGATRSPTEALDEVLVRGARLRELRAAAIRTQDAVISRYNELTKDDDLRIECGRLTPTGTHFSYRYCQLRLQRRAQEMDATAFMNFMHSLDQPTADAPPVREVGVRLMERSEEYRRNLARLLEDNPDLRELVHASDEALQRYEAARRPKRPTEQ